MISDWLRERFALKALEYPIPARANRLDFMLGALTLVALTSLAATGIVLTQFYDPNPLAAHDSVRYLVTHLPLITFVRDMHLWSATAAVLLVFTHLAFVFWRRGFQRPREGLWWSGVVLLALLLALALTGTLLKGDQESIEALQHAIAGAAMAGPLGAPFQPSFTPSSPLLTRMYGVHVAVLPIALVVILSLHLWLVRHLGVSANGETRVAFRTHLRPLGGFALIVIALIAIASLVWPAPLLAPGVGGYEVTKPFWPFLWFYASENLFGLTGMILAPAVLFGFLALVPVLDQGGARRARVTRWVGVLLLLLIVLGVIYAALAPGQAHLNMKM